MRIVFLYIVVLLISGCILKYDPLEYYVEGYEPNNSDFRCNGYYFISSPDTISSESWPEAVRVMYFFKNGTFKIGSIHKDLITLDNSICKYGCSKYGPFGFYKLDSDTILIEYIVTDPMGDHKARRVNLKAINLDTSIRIFEWNSITKNEIWKFRENKCIPDSLNIWLETHRKYKL